MSAYAALLALSMLSLTFAVAILLTRHPVIRRRPRPRRSAAIAYRLDEKEHAR